MSTAIDPETQLGTLVRENPQFAPVFESFGIDYCCGGDAALSQACTERNLEVETVLEALSAAEPGDGEAVPDTLSGLVDDIVENHHDYLRAELPSLERVVRKVTRVHGDTHPELHGIESDFLDLKAEVEAHIVDEEENVFPVVVALEEESSAASSAELVEAFDHLEDEHEAAASLLADIRAKSDDYAIPEDACTSYRNVLDRLEMLEGDMHRHVHTENNVLFPEAEALLETR
ncbi:iron-sulfur cluster repair di-iron protein [Natrarchaeobius sp. A-rgal3]|uniref:iron-sulfur cluster repair di-iron protein n=1 Tax=Natrarchaeobius versutus TaxID=1679078 RepID=UPI00350EEEA1